MTHLEYEIENKRRWTATKVAAYLGIPYAEVLPILQRMGVHSNWTEWELYNRPTDIAEIAELVEEYLHIN